MSRGVASALPPPSAGVFGVVEVTTGCGTLGGGAGGLCNMTAIAVPATSTGAAIMAATFAWAMVMVRVAPRAITEGGAVSAPLAGAAIVAADAAAADDAA